MKAGVYIRRFFSADNKMAVLKKIRKVTCASNVSIILIFRDYGVRNIVEFSVSFAGVIAFERITCHLLLFFRYAILQMDMGVQTHAEKETRTELRKHEKSAKQQ